MIEMVIPQRRRSLGGFDVGRVLPAAERRMVGPFVFFDHMGPLDLAPGVSRDVDVRPHPHIGLSTVTYLFSGEIVHRDSVGSSRRSGRERSTGWSPGAASPIRSASSGRGAQGDHLHGIQAWVALPKADEETEPSSVITRAVTCRCGRKAVSAAD